MIKVEIKGLKELTARLDKGKEHLRRETSAILEAGAKKWVEGAKKTARDKGVFDEGRLVGAISFYKSGPLTFFIVSMSEYAAYNEWGTITKVNVPAAESSYAAQFKGRGIRKNGGLLPRPYFFPQGPLVKPFVEKGIQSMLNDL